MILTDTHHRTINYLRISVTDRCNLRCIYCMPPQGVPKRDHTEILRYEEIAAIVRVAAQMGIHTFRLTGGEPLVRPGIVDLVKMLAGVPGVEALTMTTNGILLAKHAQALAEAGLQRVNVSLDTFQPERFTHITRCGELADTLAGIRAAQAAGLEPVKINTVVMRGINDDEIIDFARKTLEGWHVRFIELMPLGSGGQVNAEWRRRLVPAQEIRARVEAAMGGLQAGSELPGSGPARTFRLAQATGTVGFIAPVSEHVCHTCNRLRLTADGHLRPCLLSDEEIDLRGPLRAGAPPSQITDLIRQAIVCKPRQHHLAENEHPHSRTMSEIGG